MPVTKVSFHPPRDYEVEALTIQNEVVTIVPVLTSRTYIVIGDIVVECHDGPRRIGRLEVHHETGEIRLVRWGETKPTVPRPAPPHDPLTRPGSSA